MTTTQKIAAYLDRKGFVFTQYPSKKCCCTSADNYIGVIGAIKYVVSRSSFDKTDPSYTLGKFIKDLVNCPFIARYNAITGEQLTVIPENATHAELMEICAAKVKAMLKAKGVDENSELLLWRDDWSRINITAKGQPVICSSNPFNC